MHSLPTLLCSYCDNACRVGASLLRPTCCCWAGYVSMARQPSCTNCRQASLPASLPSSLDSSTSLHAAAGILQGWSWYCIYSELQLLLGLTAAGFGCHDFLSV